MAKNIQSIKLSSENSTFPLKLLTAIFIFYLLYAPSLFFTPILSFFIYLRAIFVLEGFFYFLSYFLILAIALALIFVSFRAYQKSKGLYLGSIQDLSRKTLYGLFAIFLLAGVASAGIYPEAYKPMTDYLGDTIYTLSAGNIQAFKGTDVANYKKIKSLGEFASSLSSSIAKTSQNISQSNQEYKASLDDATKDLQKSITRTNRDLQEKINDDIAGKLSIEGGTITGDVTLNKVLTIENTTYSKSIIPQDSNSFYLGSSEKSFSVIYVSEISGIDSDLNMNGKAIVNLKDPTQAQEAATKNYVDLAVAGAGSPLTFSYPLINTANTITLSYTPNLQVTANALDTIQGITTLSSPTFAGLTIGTGTGILKSTAGLVSVATAGTDYENPLTFTTDPLLRTGNAITLQYNTDNFRITSNKLNTIQDITTSSSPTFGGMVINETGTASGDFRAEGDTDANLFFADASLDAIGIGVVPVANTKVKISRTGTAGGGLNVTNTLTNGGGVGIAGYNFIANGNVAADATSTGLDFGNYSFTFGETTFGSATHSFVGANFFGLTSFAMNGSYINAKKIVGVSAIGYNDSYGPYVTTISEYSAAFYGASDSAYGTGSNPRQYIYYAEKPANATANYQFAGAGSGDGTGLFLNMAAANAASQSYARIYSPANSQLRIGTAVSGVFTDYMSFYNNMGYPNVGIGTTTPGYNLSVASANANTYIEILNSGGVGKGAFFGVNGNDFELWSYQGGDTVFYSGLGATVYEAMRLQYSTRNVGIGTSSPTGRLHVKRTNNAVTTNSYDGYFENLATNSTTDSLTKSALHVISTGAFAGSSGGATSNYGIYLATTSGADNNYQIYDQSGANLTTTGTWTNASDANKKKDIIDLKYGLSDLMKLRPVNYNWKLNNLSDIGFIAQEVKQVIPEVVYGQDGNMSMSYGNLTALLTKSIQEQQIIIGDQASANIEQENKILTLAEFKEATNEKIASINTQLEEQETLNANLQAQIDELKAITNQELNLAQIGLNTEEIESLKMALGIEYVYQKDEDGEYILDENGKKVLTSVDLGTSDLIGKFKTQETQTGKLTIIVNDEEDATIGEGKIEGGESKVVITNENVKEDSKIFVTPRVKTEKTLAVTEIKDGEFTVEIPEALEEEESIDFDWWIVDVKK